VVTAKPSRRSTFGLITVAISSDVMRDLVLTNDLVLISYVEALLAGHGIEVTVFDRNISLMEGSIGAFPRRVVVAADTWARARRVLEEAGLGEWVAGHEHK
jgi:Putative prokaryotic signal transducing protein